MNEAIAVVLLAGLLAGPIALAPLERNLELYFLALGLISAVAARCLDWELAQRAARGPILIVVVTIAAGLLFALCREVLDRIFVHLRRRLSRVILTGLAVLTIALASSLVTAIVAALILVELTGLLRLSEQQRVRVAVLGCFAIGLGSALTPLGGPLSTLAAAALGLDFTGLFRLLAPFVLPAVVVLSLASGLAARADEAPERSHKDGRESLRQIIIQGLKVYAFIAGLMLIGEAFAPMAAWWVERLGPNALFWANTTSAALDNSTLVALEFHGLPQHEARSALLSLLISGGMLVPGNIPNIVCAGILKISSYSWARIGIPVGLLMLGIYFAVLQLLK